ncbi:PREDICTED: ankyrin repeat and LEM domain-containing protein 1-like [Ceratosolen solmsi marchali]|uniref:Ankyrin repeat and LEM domain-containing protein 1-like n=1 Tax=Ceratosolen solmsi marchali TaxID=326594 RepID=A0AAJ7DUW5_9HYME|nr:PREDICTED: ankyrin repeat and LEM domain-containing protein 1-like [Ceratosolen solmsi marchali]
MVSKSMTEKVIEKQNFQNFDNPKESSDSLQYLKNFPLLKSKNSFSEAKFDSYNKNKYIENKENINIRSLLSEANKISYRNKYSSHKHFDLGTSFSMETEYKYKDPEKDLVLLERSLCISPFDISSMNNSFHSCTTAKSELLKKNIYLLDNNTLRERLKNLGENPGPITNRTYHLYLKYLHKLENQQRNFMHLNSISKAYIKYLNNMGREKKMLKFSRLSTEWIKKLDDFEAIEQKVFQEFVNPTPSHKWREGNSKNSFNYLLLDPRITNNFPQRASKLTLSEKWEIFLSAIFYVGKGKQSRPYAHLYDAFKLWVSHDQQNFINMKIQRILDIWNDGKGVIVLHIFQNTIPVEAYTREAAMIEMLGTQKLGNCKRGDYYGIVATWKKREKYELGKYLLFKALQILLVEGERQIFPDNL